MVDGIGPIDRSVKSVQSKARVGGNTEGERLEDNSRVVLQGLIV